LAIVAGLCLSAEIFSPQRASALDLWYNLQKDQILGNTGSLDGNANDFYVLGNIVNSGTSAVQITLTTNFGQASHFAGQAVVFDLADGKTPTAVSCTTSTLSGTITPSPNTSVCSNSTPNFTTTDGSFIGSIGWALQIFLPPPPSAGGPLTQLGSAGEIQTFIVEGLQESDFITNTSLQTPDGAVARGSYSCTHAQGVAGAPGSTLLCATVAPGGSKVPGPLPLLGAAAAFGYSRKLRTRIQGSRQQANIS
jgi:hypothetical protein